MSAPPAKPTKRGGIATLSSLRAEQSQDGSQGYYVGGGGSGGGNTEVYDPARDGGSGAPGRIIDLAQRQTAAADSGPPADLKHRIVLYRNGFTLNDGPFRPYDDPANEAFLQAVQLGRTPQELSPDGRDVDVEVIAKRDESFVPAAAPAPSFAGEGLSLRAAPAADGVLPVDSSAQKPVVDDGQPATTVQVRMVDGRRLTVRLNLTHTVRDLRSAVDAENPGGAAYALQLSFPRKLLTDLSATIKDAGLAGAAVQQTV